ncbi:hypothetical protein D3C75_473680 [compost metagenome]
MHQEYSRFDSVSGEGMSNMFRCLNGIPACFELFNIYDTGEYSKRAKIGLLEPFKGDVRPHPKQC